LVQQRRCSILLPRFKSQVGSLSEVRHQC
jgi:hypothetical protein